MKRPGVITFFCVLGYLGILVTFPQVFSPAVKKLGVFMPALYGLLVALQFMATVGIWYYKRWGVELYLMSFFGKFMFFMLTDQMGVGSWIGTVISITFIIILLRHYKRMDTNL